MTITEIPEAQPADDGLGGREAPAALTDLRRSLNLSSFKYGLCWLAGGTVISSLAILGTAGFAVMAIANWQVEAALFGGVTAATALMATAFTLSCARELIKDHRHEQIRADRATEEGTRLFMQNLHLLAERARREEGGAGDGAGGSATSPASNLRFIPHKGRINV